MRRALLINSLLFILLISAAEMLARVVDWGNSARTLPRVLPEMVYIDHGSRFSSEGLGDNLGSVSSLTVALSRFPYHVSTNREGFRGSDELQNGRSTVLVLGASYTFGSYVNDADTFPFLLQSAFNKQAGGPARIQVLNGGVPGYGTGSVLDYLRDKGVRLKPDLVIVQMGVPLYYEEDDGGEFRKELQRMDRGRSIKDFLKQHSAIVNVLNGLRHQSTGGARQAESARATEVLHNRRLAFDSSYPESVQHWNKVENQLVELRDLVSSFGGKAYILLFPTVEQIADPTYPTVPQERASEIARRINVGFIDALPKLRGSELDALLLSWYPHSKDDFRIQEYSVDYPKPFRRISAGDGHFSKYGNFLIANAIFDVLLAEERLFRRKGKAD